MEIRVIRIFLGYPYHLGFWNISTSFYLILMWSFIVKTFNVFSFFLIRNCSDIKRKLCHSKLKQFFVLHIRYIKYPHKYTHTCGSLISETILRADTEVFHYLKHTKFSY